MFLRAKSRKMARASSVEFTMYFKVDFKTAIRVHQVYVDFSHRRRTRCRLDTRAERKEHVTNVIGGYLIYELKETLKPSFYMVFPYDHRCRSIFLKLGRGDLGLITNFWARIWHYFENAGRCERTTSQTSTSNRRYACPHGNTAQEKRTANS